MSSEKRMRCRFWDDKRDDLEEVIALKLSISNLPCQGLEIGKMRAIPSDIGIEIFCECGSAYYWEHWLPRLLEGRNGTFSVHAPFQNLNLSDPNANFEEIRRAYHEAFALCARYGGRHCVCHPYDGKRPENDTLEQLEVAKRCSLERVLQLNQESREYGVELLVENMPQKHGMLDQDGFMELFAPYDELHFLIDTGHANLQAWDLEQMFQRLGTGFSHIISMIIREIGTAISTPGRGLSPGILSLPDTPDTRRRRCWCVNITRGPWSGF